MKLYGKLMNKNMPLKINKVENLNSNLDFHGQIESLFIDLCKNLDIPVPIWLKKNTRELSRYKKTFFNKEQKKTFFNKEQFIEEVYFDNFILEIEV